MRKKTSTKLYYSITEVAELANVKPHVLRYWETEFKALHPKKNRAGNRTYRAGDIKLIRDIKKLLYDEHFTIKGAKQRLKELKQEGQLDLQSAFEESRKKTALDDVRRELKALLALLEGIE